MPKNGDSAKTNLRSNVIKKCFPYTWRQLSRLRLPHIWNGKEFCFDRHSSDTPNRNPIICARLSPWWTSVEVFHRCSSWYKSFPYVVVRGGVVRWNWLPDKFRGHVCINALCTYPPAPADVITAIRTRWNYDDNKKSEIILMVTVYTENLQKTTEPPDSIGIYGSTERTSNPKRQNLTVKRIARYRIINSPKTSYSARSFSWVASSSTLYGHNRARSQSSRCKTIIISVTCVNH